VWCCGIKEPQPTVTVPFGRLTLPSALHLPFACSSASHFLVVCSPSVFVCFSPQQHTQPPSPPFHHTPNFLLVPGTNPLTVNHVKLQTCHYHFTHPHRPSTRQFGALETGHQPGSCSPSAMTLSGLSSTPPPGGPLRARPDFPEPAALAAGANR
jgi:hypothetical protein